jgi:FkbM family methyltransferase
MTALNLSTLRPTLKQLVTRGAARLGYQVVPLWRLKAFEQCRHLRHLLAQLGVTTVLDIGANTGGYRDLLRRYIGYNGRIVSFEPVPSVFAALRAQAAGDAQWSGHQMALGDSDGELAINVTSRSTMSSFLPRDEARLQHLGYAHLLNVTEVVATERVPVRRLDGVFDAVVGDRGERVFLKCDTQGYDLKVMAGAEAILPSIVAVQIELSIKPVYTGAPAYVEVMERMSALGFDVTGIFPVRQDELSRILNFDCVMINSRHPFVQSLASRLVTGRNVTLESVVT